MDNIALGKYLPLDSIVHRFDPRAKIVAMILLMISLMTSHRTRDTLKMKLLLNSKITQVRSLQVKRLLAQVQQ